MVAGSRQLLGLALVIIGFLGTIIICALPQWKVTIFNGSDTTWGGLWKFCTLSTGQMHCGGYENFSLLLTQDLQAARVLIVIAIIIGVFGILLGVAEGKCSNFVLDERQKHKVAVACGTVFIIAGFLVLIPVCWTASTHRYSHNPFTSSESQKRELGASLYIGFCSAGLLFLGGGLLCCSHP